MWSHFDTQQINILGILSANIIGKYKILPNNVVGHSDICAERKQDPGILFPWQELYQKYGVGAWLSNEEQNHLFISSQYLPKEPLPKGISEAFFIQQLVNYGYKCDVSAYTTPDHYETIKAFKAHFSANNQPSEYNEQITEKEMLWIWGLNAKYIK